MGKGDRKSKKGKRTMGSHGNTRPKKNTTNPIVVTTVKTKKEASPKSTSPSKTSTLQVPQSP